MTNKVVNSSQLADIHNGYTVRNRIWYDVWAVLHDDHRRRTTKVFRNFLGREFNDLDTVTTIVRRIYEKLRDI